MVGVETAGVEKRKNKKVRFFPLAIHVSIQKKASMKGEKTETLDIESKKKTNEPVKITVDVEEGRQVTGPRIPYEKDTFREKKMQHAMFFRIINRQRSKKGKRIKRYRS